MTFQKKFVTIKTNKDAKRRVKMENENGVIAIMPNGAVIASTINEINSKHWCCFDDIETKLNLK